MGFQIINIILTGSYTCKESWPGAHKGGSYVLTSESVTGKEISFLKFNKMSSDKMDTTDITVEQTPVTEAPTTSEAEVTATTASTPTQVDTAEGSGERVATNLTPGVQHTASNLNRLHLSIPKLSGAQRRKLDPLSKVVVV
uniref:Uncharacterized protein n=1 Tax=Cacopsylla melanoneura TaxID=428564 RepID=A0A8D9FCX4_9HEMI